MGAVVKWERDSAYIHLRRVSRTFDGNHTEAPPLPLQIYA